MSLGFAAFSASLDLASNAFVSPDSATFNVKFSTSKDELIESDVVPSDITSGLSASNGVIDNSQSPTLKNLSVSFTSPGQYVEYTFYARNEGEYTAYLNSINYFGEKTCTASEDATVSLVEDACSYINMTTYVEEVEYNNTTQISGHSLVKNTGEEIKVRISYEANAPAVDGEFNITFGDVILVYSTIDDAKYIPPDSVLDVTYLSDIIKENAISDSDINFSTTPDTGTFMVSTTENDSYPIYYYRGAVTNNNVKFANFCWKMVRTTETGGVKLIYNGVPAEDGSCNNTGTASQLASTSAFNSSYNSPAYVGYMYGAVYTAVSKNLSRQSETYVYGNDVNWDGTSYTLADTTTSSSWSTDRTTLATKYHYTCFNTTGTCTEVYYINFFGDASSAYYLTLKDGKDIEDAKEEMFVNTTDSKIKTVIDSWYASNMTGYTNMLEDTVWCNDRTISGGPLYSKDANDSSSFFGSYSRNAWPIAPSLTCPNKLDSFTVNSSKGNGSLIYPVGLLTADEYTLAGSGNKSYSATSYLYTGQYQWSLSPYFFDDIDAAEFSLYPDGFFSVAAVNTLRGVRPAISLKHGVIISGGNGDAVNPYIVYES